MSHVRGLSDRSVVLFVLAVVLSVFRPAGGKAGDAFDDLLDSLPSDIEPLHSEEIEALLRDAAALRENPIDLNAAGLAELARIPWLSPAQALRLVRAVQVGGPATSLAELWKRASIPSGIGTVIRPYVCVRAPVTAGPDVVEVGRTARRRPVELRARVGTATGGENPWDPGAFVRVRGAVSPTITWGVGVERDANEATLADHVAGHVSWTTTGTDRGPTAELVAGDIKGSWGQGLVLGGGGFSSRSRYPIARDRVWGYDGASEWSSRRGLAALLRRGVVECRLLVCRTALDATVVDGLVTARRTTGLHTTESEVQARGAQTEELVAARVVVANDAWRLGGSLLSGRFDPGFAQGHSERQRFAFSGNQQVVGAVDVRYADGRWRVGGELARTQGGATSWIAAVRTRYKALRVGCGGAFASRAFWSPTGGGVPGAGEGSNSIAGWLSVDLRATERWSIGCEGEYRTRPWRSYHEPLPGRRRTLKGRCSWRGERSFLIELEVRERVTCEQGDPSGTTRRRHRRWRLRARSVAGLPVRATTMLWEEEQSAGAFGNGVGFDVAWRGAVGDWCADVGVAVLSDSGGAAPIRWTPGLPGEWGLSSWARGVSWWCRVTRSLSSWGELGVRVSAAAEDVSFGMGVEMP
ncbi:MAG: hypothetical protein GF405_10990 [Candidatus Eisenbacteria bacterium]|nr:hypothetical protein [Candidatus Eisenbacteria bacterium]